MKTIEQIAADCGLDESSAELLDRIMGSPEDHETYEVCVEGIIVALYRRIERLEEHLEKAASDYTAIEVTIPDGFFQELSEEEVAEFKKWARENYKPGEPISGLWHPVVRFVCLLMNRGL